MNMRIFKVHQSEEGQTLEKYIQKLLMSAPSSFIYKIFRKKDVKVNGHHEDRKFTLSENDEVIVSDDASSQTAPNLRPTKRG